MGTRKRKSQGGVNWGLILGVGGFAVVLLIAAGVAAFLLTRPGGQQAGKQPTPGTAPRTEYDEYITYDSPGPRTAWTRIRKVVIVDKWYRKLDRLHQELPPAWRANSLAEADAVVLVVWDKLTGMGNAAGDGKVITFTPFDMHRAKVEVFSRSKEYYGDALLTPLGKATSTTAADVIGYLEMLNASAKGPK